MHRRLISGLIIVACASMAVGCQKTDDGLSQQEQKMTDRLGEIAKSSGGDWDKLSQADRDYLVNEVSRGSETSARMLLQAKSGRLKAKPGGPGGPTPGGPANR